GGLLANSMPPNGCGYLLNCVMLSIYTRDFSALSAINKNVQSGDPEAVIKRGLYAVVRLAVQAHVHRVVRGCDRSIVGLRRRTGRSGHVRDEGACQRRHRRAYADRGVLGASGADRKSTRLNSSHVK